MERVVFLLEETNARLSCMLNPESLTFRRQSGVKLSALSLPPISGGGRVAQSVLTGSGGHTELELDLLFDVSLSVGSTIRSNDVRDHTRPIWALSETSDFSSRTAMHGKHQPSLRFVWGKSWNVSALVLNVSERFEAFDSMGRPGRSWMRMRLLVTEGTAIEQRPTASLTRSAMTMKDVDPRPSAGWAARIHVAAEAPDANAQFSSDRLDELAQRYYRNPGLWRLIARANQIIQPNQILPGQRLTIPDYPGSG